ncbi:3-methyladenine DNA glycosylase [Nakamurella flavida]|uniref:3-methyladenine DNA glycosylase n=1 Tax=Nakamurella flavida TaxID=363630 RepID=UPI0035225831
MDPAADPAGHAGSVTLTRAEWLEKEQQHRTRVDDLLAGHRERAARGRAHPVEDFLFTYYSQRPGHLRRWFPGVGVVLQDADERVGQPWALVVPGTDRPSGVVLDAAGFAERRAPLLAFLHRYLAATASATPVFGCFGLHEWAMVYRDGAGGDEAPGSPAGPTTATSGGMGGRRHAQYPLRLGAAGTDAVVEEAGVRCTHFDAFRFFTPEARPRNAGALTREGAVHDDQPGCLHVGMDLYKWAYKLAPAVPAELVVDCFVLARDIRELDMRASPYDLTALGYSPVPIETAQGRSRYAAEQRAMTVRARPLRERLRAVVAELRAATPPVPGN